MTLEDVRPAGIVLWEENQPAIDLFDAMQTQWQTGLNGPIGLNYQSVPLIMRLQNIRRSQWTQMFQDLRVLEAAALKEMHQG